MRATEDDGMRVPQTCQELASDQIDEEKGVEEERMNHKQLRPSWPVKPPQALELTKRTPQEAWSEYLPTYLCRG